MSMPLIKYTPDIETADPGFDENLQTVIAKTERYIAASVTAEGTGRAVRDAHAKGYGLVRGEVEILHQLCRALEVCEQRRNDLALALGYFCVWH